MGGTVLANCTFGKYLTLCTRPLNASHDLKDYLKDPVAQIAKYNN